MLNIRTSANSNFKKDKNKLAKNLRANLLRRKQKKKLLEKNNSSKLGKSHDEK